MLELKYKKLTGKALDPLFKVEIKKVVQKIGAKNLNVSYNEEQI